MRSLSDAFSAALKFPVSAYRLQQIQCEVCAGALPVLQSSGNAVDAVSSEQRCCKVFNCGKDH